MLTQYSFRPLAEKRIRRRRAKPATPRGYPPPNQQLSDCLALDLDPTGPAITITFTYQEPPCPSSN